LTVDADTARIEPAILFDGLVRQTGLDKELAGKLAVLAETAPSAGGADEYARIARTR
jgi:hypothetical protein